MAIQLKICMAFVIYYRADQMKPIRSSVGGLLKIRYNDGNILLQNSSDVHILFRAHWVHNISLYETRKNGEDRWLEPFHNDIQSHWHSIPQ